MADNEFGGGWTSIKLDVLEQYLRAWLNVMKNQSFDRIYIDAFAGSGRCIIKGISQPMDGSAIRAMKCEGFDRYYFFEKKKKFANALSDICDSEEFSARASHVWQGDGNELIQSALKLHDWKRTRAVIFLDPFGMEVEWSTLQAIAETQAADLWYLFPISGIFRNAAKKYSNVDPAKEAALTRALGADDWKNAFYTETPQGDFFDNSSSMERDKDVNDLERYVQERLGTLFPMVLEPRRLLGQKNIPLFSLFFAVSNPSRGAQKIAKDIAEHLINNN